MAEETGQESGSLTDEAGTGQELETESPAVELSMTDQIVKAASEMEESAASEETEQETQEAGQETEKPAPYDQDPKWKAARAAEKRLNDMLEKHGVEDVDELDAMLESGMSITEILGNRDAKQLIEDSNYLKKVKEHWDEQERLKEEEDLDPDELAEKYKKELDDFKQTDAQKKAEAEKIEANKTAIKRFEDGVNKAIESQGFVDGEAELAKLILGVDNPIYDVDIDDSKAVRTMTKTQTDRVRKIVDDIKQGAIDQYAAGKSKFTPIAPSGAPEKTVAQKEKELPKDATVDEVFADGKAELLEFIRGGASP